MSEKYNFLVTCPPFCEDLLGEDCQKAGISSFKKGPGFLSGAADYASLLRVIFYSPIAGRVYLNIHHFAASDYDELYQMALNFPWDEQMKVDQSFSISVQSKRTSKTDNRFAVQRLKDGLCDYFRKKTTRRPSVDSEQADAPFYVFWDDKEASLYYDLSGQSLHRRGYREALGKADLKENLAAAIIRRSGWLDKFQDYPLADPFCGSGTLVIEALLMALEIPPGPLRSYYGFKGWKHHDQGLWEQLCNENSLKIMESKKMPLIWASDVDPRAIQLARQNAEKAGVSSYIHFHRIDFFEFQVARQISKPGFMLMNAPYGQRLDIDEDMTSFYHLLGRQLKTQWHNWKTGILAPKELTLSIGLKAEKNYRFNNGTIACQLALFNINDSNRFNPLITKPIQNKTRVAYFEDNNQEMLINRLKKNHRILKSWLKRENISSYRLYDADIPEYNGAIDIYEGKWVVIQEYQAPKEIPFEKAFTRLKTMVQAVEKALGLGGQFIYIKQRSHQKGSQQYRAHSHLGIYHTIEEGGLKFYVNFIDYLDTGIFLDHRPVRGLVKKMSQGKNLLNLFSYTGTVSCYALSGSALRVVNVDASKNYLAWADENLKLNGFHESSYQNICSDCFEYLKDNTEKFDLVFCDPPTFSNSKSRQGHFDIQRDYPGLLRLIKKSLKPGGEIIFSCNYRGFKLDPGEIPFEEIREITKQSIPEDFEKNPRIHQVWIFK
ncbi:MAG: bifunctional 23S rRNA (guanine(2069)-N(7))-methyltransferase RlmK/23S rRNA (guanine(2445)-N(2))-methyltransferase RlmL [Spirochaetales bacterium]|nr:bifunctional 23S rRNA (guanine(2069)-N(7))-methyltransferase RlmK/23S rRNA (guanine(2445)-N(2))-methyltransferase RlmL [Spirochaetales bacterium]